MYHRFIPLNIVIKGYNNNITIIGKSNYFFFNIIIIYIIEAESYIPKLASDYLKREEFSQIITSYIGEPVNENEQIQIKSNEELNKKNIYENDIKSDLKKKHFTFDEMKNHFQDESFSWYTPEIETTNDKSVDVATIEANLQENTSIISRREASKYINTIDDYPLGIRIPKSAWKEGYTYRVKDCFYDDKGDFLYRVPGLITNENEEQKQYNFNL